MRLAAALFETNSSSSSSSAELRVNRSGWYVVYSTARWPECARTSTPHGVYADSRPITNGHRRYGNRYGSDGGAGCRDTSHHLVVAAFIRDAVRATASSAAETDRTHVNVKLLRLS